MSSYPMLREETDRIVSTEVRVKENETKEQVFFMEFVVFLQFLSLLFHTWFVLVVVRWQNWSILNYLILTRIMTTS